MEVFPRHKVHWRLVLLVLCLPIYRLSFADVSDSQKTIGSGTENFHDSENLPRAKELLELGNLFASRGYLVKAREYWNAALSVDPRLTEAQDHLKAASSGVNLEITDSGKEERVKGFLSKAKAAYEGKNYDLALNYLRPVDELSPENPEAKTLRNKIALETFQFDSEEENESLVKDYFEKAVDYYRNKNYAKSLQLLQQAEQIVPGQAQVEKLKAIILTDYSDVLINAEIQNARDEFDRGNYQVAMEILNHILGKNPLDKTAIELRKKINEAGDKEGKDIVRIELDKGREAEKKDNFIEAKKCYERALKADRQNKEASEGIKRVLKLIDPVKEKEDELEKAVQNGWKAKAVICLNQIREILPDYARMKYWEKRISELKNDSGETLDSQAKADETYNLGRSEERRVGKECRSRWSPY